MEVSPDGTFAVGGVGQSITVIDLVAEAEVARITCSTLPSPCPISDVQGVEFARDGRTAYMVDFGNRKLHTIDVSTPSSPALVSSLQLTTSNRPWELELDGDRAYVVAWPGSDVLAVDLSGAIPVQVARVVVGSGAFEIGLRPAGLTPEGAIVALLDQIAALADVLNAGQARSLIGKLEAAAASLERGNANAAIGQLGAFIKEVEALVASGRLPASVGAELVALAQAAIDQLRQG